MTAGQLQRQRLREHESREGVFTVLWRGAMNAAVPALCWFIGLCALGVVAGAVLVGVHGDGGALTGFGGRVVRWFRLHHLAWIVSAAEGAAPVGSFFGLVIIAAVVGVVLWFLGRRVRAFVPLVACLGAELMVFVVKDLIERHRPASAAAVMYPWVSHSVRQTDYSFPSGHATATAALVFAVAALVVGRGSRWWPWVVAAVVAVAMAAGRLVLGVHWFSDVLVGFCLGTAWGMAIATVLREPAKRRRRSAPPVPS